MIVKNEADVLADCLSSVRGFVDEMIVLDTGSTDDTPRIAEKFGAKVIQFPWNNDFAAARNESIRHATGDWILVLDADETLDANAKEKIHHIIRAHGKGKILGYRTPIRNYFMLHEGETKSGAIPIQPSPFTKNANAYFQSTTIRLFQNKKEIYYTGKIHELLNIDKDMVHVMPSGIVIHHYGYLQDPAKLEKKKKLYLQMGIEKAAKEKTPESLVELGSLYFDRGEAQGNLEKARECLEKAIAIKPNVPEWYLTLAIIHKKKKDYSRAEYVLRQAVFLDQKTAVRYLNPHPYPYIFASLGEIFYRKKQYTDAAFLFEKALKEGHPQQQMIEGALATCREKIKQPKTK